MSRRDGLLIPDPGAIPEGLRAPIGSVSCAAFFFVLAADLDAIPRPAMLAWLGLSARVFERTEERWREAVAIELRRDEGVFDEVYLDLISRALCLWDRPVSPLDSEVETWVHYQRHAALAEQPLRFAERLGLTRGDELRLARRFRERLARLDGEPIAARAAAALAGELSPLPPIVVGPVVFPPSREAP